MKLRESHGIALAAILALLLQAAEALPVHLGLGHDVGQPDVLG